MKNFARNTFGILVHLHPHEFRTEFGNEMLWIFDEQMNGAERGTARFVLYVQLSLDVLRSAFTQRILRERPRLETVGPHFAQLESTSRVMQVAQGGFIVFACLVCMFSIVLFLQMTISNL